MNYVAIKYEADIKLLIMLHKESRKQSEQCSQLRESIKLKLIYLKINFDQTENTYHYKYSR